MNKFLIVFILLVPFAFYSVGQKIKCDSVYTSVDRMPIYKDGNPSLYRYLGEHIVLKKHCKPPQKLFFTFTVDAGGHVINLHVKGLPESCKENILEQIKGIGLWTPGTLKGNPVCVDVMLPMYICYK